jgi:hypothetical protein
MLPSGAACSSSSSGLGRSGWLPSCLGCRLSLLLVRFGAYRCCCPDLGSGCGCVALVLRCNVDSSFLWFSMFWCLMFSAPAVFFEVSFVVLPRAAFVFSDWFLSFRCRLCICWSLLILLCCRCCLGVLVRFPFCFLNVDFVFNCSFFYLHVVFWSCWRLLGPCSSLVILVAVVRPSVRCGWYLLCSRVALGCLAVAVIFGRVLFIFVLPGIAIGSGGGGLRLVSLLAASYNTQYLQKNHVSYKLASIMNLLHG